MLDPFKIQYKRTEDGCEVSYTYTEDEATEAEIQLLEDILNEMTNGKQWNTDEVIGLLQGNVYKIRSKWGLSTDDLSGLSGIRQSET